MSKFTTESVSQKEYLTTESVSQKEYLSTFTTERVSQDVSSISGVYDHIPNRERERERERERALLGTTEREKKQYLRSQISSKNKREESTIK